MCRLALLAVAVAAASLLGPAQPTYDPWAWLLWGREVLALDLSTVDGPAWKPGPVLFTAPVSLAGDAAAPPLWLLAARTGAVLAVLLAGRVAWRLAPRARPLAAAVAAAAVVLTAGWPWHSAVGHTEPLLVALALAALDRALDGRHRAALALGFGAALLRPEAWPFLGVYALWRWRRAPAERPALAAAAAALPLLWLAPELWGSGDLWRSGARARIPNPGQPAMAAVPGLAALDAAAALAFWPLALLALAAPRGAARLPAVAGVAWVGLVALMAQALGTSGEPRYALPGVALAGVSAGAGAARLARGRGVLAVAALAAVALLPARVASHGRELTRVADEAQLYATLDDAVAAAGGARRLRACGRPATGRLRGPAVAYALRVHKARVLAPGTGAIVLRSRIRRGARVQPPSGAPLLGRSARWEVRGRC